MIMNFFNPAPNERLDVIRDLKPGAKGLNLQVIVLDIGTRTTTKDNHELRTFKVADRTGSVNICVWDEPGAYIQQGDILRMHRCYASNYKNQLTVYTGRGGKIVKIGEFAMNFCEVPFMSDPTQMGGAGEQQMAQQQQQQPNNMIQ